MVGRVPDGFARLIDSPSPRDALPSRRLDHDDRTPTTRPTLAVASRMVDWNACPAGERETNRASGALVFRGTGEETYNGPGGGRSLSSLTKRRSTLARGYRRRKVMWCQLRALSGCRGRFRRLKHPKREKGSGGGGPSAVAVLGACVDAQEKHRPSERGNSHKEQGFSDAAQHDLTLHALYDNMRIA